MAQLKLLSWNIQSGLACDGVRDINRTIDYLKAQPEQQLICLQEVARYFAEYCSTDAPDQLAAISQAFPDYQPVWGACLSWPGEGGHRKEFGNLTLVKAELLDQRIHPLPICSDNTDSWQTPRCAVETLINIAGTSLRVLNTHLAFHNASERRAQLDALTQLAQRQSVLEKQPPVAGPGIYSQPWGNALSLLCGDLNFTPQQTDYRRLSAQGWHDLTTDSPARQPTCGLDDPDQWPEGSHCRDYVWCRTPQSAQLRVDTDCRLSDHQPVQLILDLIA